ncbi:histidine kinase [Tolypothrix sp. VBCCA 56010]|uniref:histidine kinase n=1 Tax=Tolypothrix sp. VBCCA 56010 TaxID=3137731 RepID=UPI003D7EBF39
MGNGHARLGAMGKGNKKKFQNFTWTMPDARCPMPDARCPMPDARCPMPDAPNPS